jgi:hypothetical protein
MKKIIRLTESDLNRITKKIISEESDSNYYSNQVENIREELKDVWVKISRMIKLIDNDDSLSSEEKNEFKSDINKFIRPLSLLTKEHDTNRF